MRLLSSLVAGTAALVLTASAAAAQDSGPAPTPSAASDIDVGKDTVMVGVGVGSVPTYEGSDNRRIVPVPAIRGSISGYSFSTRGTKLVVDLARNDPGPVWDFQLGPVIGLNLNRTGDPHDTRVDLLGRRKAALELGGYIGIGKTGVITSDYDKLSASVMYTHDVTNVNRSYTLTPQIDYGTPLSTKAYVGISGSATYAGDNYANTYFGISRAAAIKSGLPAFNPKAGWKNWSLSALGTYSLTGNLLHGFQVVGLVSYSRLLNDFARSPVTSIAGERGQWTYAAGLAYAF